MTDRRLNYRNIVWLVTAALFFWLCVSTNQPAASVTISGNLTQS